MEILVVVVLAFWTLLYAVTALVPPVIDMDDRW